VLVVVLVLVLEIPTVKAWTTGFFLSPTEQ
jgi:hypothetical protein